MFILTILEKIQETRLKYCNTVLQKMANYQEARIKLTITKLLKLKSAAKNKAETILRLNQKTLKMKNCHANYF